MQEYGFSVIQMSTGSRNRNTRDCNYVERDIDMLPPPELAVHAHSYYTITYVHDCDDYPFWIDGYKLVQQKNWIYLQTPQTLHTSTSRLSGFQRYTSIHFFVSAPLLMQKIGLEALALPCDQALQAMLLEIIGCAKVAHGSRVPLHELFSGFINAILTSPNLQTAVDKKRQPENEYIRLIRYMYSHMKDNLTLSDLADVLHLTPTYFSRRFKSVFQISPIKYLYAQRLFRAGDDLIKTNKSIERIALEVGFRSTAAFCSAFRRTYGLTPSKVRENFKNTYEFFSEGA